MKKMLLTIAFTLIFITGTVYAEELKFAGCSTSTISYMKDVAKAYEAKTGIKVDVKGRRRYTWNKISRRWNS